MGNHANTTLEGERGEGAGGITSCRWGSGGWAPAKCLGLQMHVDEFQLILGA